MNTYGYILYQVQILIVCFPSFFNLTNNKYTRNCLFFRMLIDYKMAISLLFGSCLYHDFMFTMIKYYTS